MSNEFEDALHQGFTRSEMAQEMDEREMRANELGCLSCVYRARASKTCDAIIEMDDTFHDCPYYKKEG